MTDGLAEQPYILYADDDPDDLLLLADTFSKTQPPVKMLGFENGRKAFSYLESIPAGHPLPGLVVLDLNMPEWNGSFTLEKLKKSDTYKHIPVYIFTNSDHPRHRATSLQMGAVEFITKPYRKSDLLEVCTRLAQKANEELRLKSG